MKNKNLLQYMQKHGKQKHAMLLEGKINWKCKF